MFSILVQAVATFVAEILLVLFKQWLADRKRLLKKRRKRRRN
jgi:hypothetical protein